MVGLDVFSEFFEVVWSGWMYTEIRICRADCFRIDGGAARFYMCDRARLVSY